MSATILVSAPTLAEAGQEVLRAEGCRVIFTSRHGGTEEMLQHLRREAVDGVISRTLPFDAQAFAAAGSTLKVISRHGVGFDNVDVATATERGIPVLIAPAGNGQSVAELTMALMLAAARRVTTQNAAIRAGNWDRSGSGLQLGTKTLGLIGFGGIGKAVARAALGFGMQVIAFDPLATPEPGLSVELVDSLQQMLPRSHFLSLHIPLNEQTRDLIGASQIAALPKGAVIVNTSRGGLIDEAALLAGLDSGHLYGAGLDTFSIEPLPASHPLCNHPNTVLTAHVGGSTDAALAATARMAAEHALAIIHGRPFDATVCVNPFTLKRISR
ncbi:NAD(P)-dependent oxidoreductase [Acidiphilium sp. JA12-A1]|uniref:NAD(P)-dependent oxidoreductase n=1 Tax=Acidiphilium sp. JA12-A1 TaxID=1464546 RepID=UPI000461BF7F|nr:NAD(P)-dependent oxidoreductase [Acidiphilium sp. JA12-A1]KDM66144.1 D-3-phosphoglycerate dehydrogenase SerA [Acidiphilium sp. JA12-A1]